MMHKENQSTMAKPEVAALSLFCVSLLLLVAASLAAASSILDDGSSFPSVHAKKLIRELNLLPKLDEVNVVDKARVSLSTTKKKVLVEKPFPFNFPNFDALSVSGVSVEDLGHHAGYFKLATSHDARMFYFFFESRNSEKDPVVIWLTGGPGSGGELSLFYENGPFTIANDISLVWNEYGWDKASNILYVDQPIGSGFSYSSDIRDIRHNEDEISNDLYDFLKAFIAEHTDFAHNDFYIAGHSYAGHYVPALAARVHRGNKAKDGIHINLKGLAIGNGLTNPAIQYKSYTDYALDMGIINKSDYNRINKLVPDCEMALKLCGTDGTTSCIAASIVCDTIINGIMAVAGDTDRYDIRKKCETGRMICYDLSNMERFLNQKSVKEALGVDEGIDFVTINFTVNQAMQEDWMRNFAVGIPALLEDGINLLLYAGEYDLLSNWLGISRWVHAMEWSGRKEFAASPEVPFLVDGSEAGVLKTHGPLAFLKVHDAGHFVPMDQPKAALEMLKRWTKGTLHYTTLHYTTRARH